MRKRSTEKQMNYNISSIWKILSFKNIFLKHEVGLPEVYLESCLKLPKYCSS